MDKVKKMRKKGNEYKEKLNKVKEIEGKFINIMG